MIQPTVSKNAQATENARQFLNKISDDIKIRDVIYLCIWERDYIGNIWNECKKGFYGPNCTAWPVNPADNAIWGKFGIWDDGIRGTGKWLCEDPELEPSLYCESASYETLHQEEEDFTWGFFLLILVAFMSLLLLYLYIKIPCLENFPESIAAVILGILIGSYFRYKYDEALSLLKILQFEPHTCMLFLLPPIMFQVGFSMNASTFFRNILTINSYAIFGTFLWSGAYSLIFFYWAKLISYDILFIDCLQFGCIISAIDPVATISIFKSFKINDRIYMIIFGESTLNNAVAIALATSIECIKGFLADGEQDFEYIDITVFTFERFWSYFFLSFIIGGAWALIISFIFASLDLYEFPWIEIGFFVLSCYFPYILCEAIGSLGVISIFVCGSVMRNYAFYSLGPFGKITIEYLVDTIGFTTENFVFAYLGISIPFILHKINHELALLGILSLMASRAISVILWSFLVQCFENKKVPLSHQIIFTYANIRGVVAFYLGLYLLSNQNNSLYPWLIWIIVFTVIGLGSTTNCLLQLLNRYFPDDKIFKEIEFEDYAFEHEKSVHMDERDLDPTKIEKQSTGLISRIENFDRDFLQPMLRKPGWEEDEPLFHDEFIEPYQHYEGSVEERFSATVKRTNKGGDLSPYRNSIMHKKNIPKEVDKSVRGQFSMRENFSKRLGKDEFITPNKNDRHSINFRRDELSALRNYNLLHVAQIMNDNHIDYSQSRRKSMRMSFRKSKFDSKSDVSYPRNRGDSGGSRKTTNNQNARPNNFQATYYKENEKRLSGDEEAHMPFRVNPTSPVMEINDKRYDSKLFEFCLSYFHKMFYFTS